MDPEQTAPHCLPYWLLKYFSRQEKQTTFVVIGALRVKPLLAPNAMSIQTSYDFTNNSSQEMFVVGILFSCCPSGNKNVRARHQFYWSYFPSLAIYLGVICLCYDRTCMCRSILTTAFDGAI